MSRITRFGLALLVAMTTLIPGKTEGAISACTIEGCFYNFDCTQYVCPAGQTAFPKCVLTTCHPYCHCRSF
jgi:hypothetical protein